MWLVLALVAAGAWGTADFLGGLAARRTPALRVLILGLPAGLAVLAPFLAADEPTRSGLAWGAASGLAGGLGIALLYAALGVGPMNVVAPLSAVMSAVVPVGVGLFQGERPSAMAYLGMAAAGVAVVLIGREPAEPAEPSPVIGHRGSLMALAAGTCIGLALVLLDRAAAEGAGLWPLAANRGSAWAVVLGAAVLTGAAGLPARVAVPASLGAGILDTFANAAYLRALDGGLLSVVGVIVALYPGGTVLLARFVLHERLHPPQVAGLLLAATGVTLLVLG